MNDLFPSGMLALAAAIFVAALLGRYRPFARLADGVLRACGLLFAALLGWLVICYWQGRADLLPAPWIFLLPGVIALGLSIGPRLSKKRPLPREDRPPESDPGAKG